MTAFGVGYRAAKQARQKSRADRASSGHLRSLGARLTDSLFIIGGLGAITTAAFLFNVEVGCLATGLSLFVLDFELSS